MTKSAEPRKVATNRKALRDYFVVERLEAGISLLGTEVKSIREGHISFEGSYAHFQGNRLILVGTDIPPYEYGHQFNHAPTRPRPLLLHRRELDRLAGQVQQKGMTLIPLSCYFNKRGQIKMEIGLCRGRQDPDKRNRLKEREADLEARRAIARHR